MSRMAAAVFSVALVAAACTGSDGDATPTTTEPTESETTTPTTEVIATDPPAEVDETPTAPTGLVVVDTTNGEITLEWDPSRSEAVNGYEITRVGAGITTRVIVAESAYVDEGLDEGDIYTYSISAISPAGQSDRSEAVTARVGADTNPPSVPGRPNVVDSDEVAVALEWRPSMDIAGIENYIVTRTIDGETVTIEVDGEKFVDDIDGGIIATYSVQAVDANGNMSEPSRAVTLLSGSSSDDIVLVVSKIADPSTDPQTTRLQQALFDAGFIVSWFEDDVFDANLTDPGDVVLLLGDVEGEGFDWNIFATDATVIGLKSLFVEGGGITENPPKLDRLAQLTYIPPGGAERDVPLTTTGRPKPAVYIPPIEQLPDLQIWARPTWSDDIAVAGLIPTGGELANEKPAPGCRAFFPGNSGSLAEQTDEGWDLLIEFVGDVAAECR